MATTLVIGLDGHKSGERVLEYGKRLAGLIKDCELLVVYVVEWSPYSFQTPEENAERHKRRENEISTAMQRVVDPAVEELKKAGLQARGVVRHGHVAEILNTVAKEENAEQIIIGRSSSGGLAERFFGSSTSNLVMSAHVPVTVIG
ncbi:universal stress protein [uncultured Sneathiella sp.]|uniref:universal stress protein n=1 Tax=uncultured Sneathiella sp. TaxID=879315 RepID=UPI0030EB9A97|tara:strand:- start:69710 stop:70147 length:438 start_codon:yes stop_codon:yes gene_type:complete